MTRTLWSLLLVPYMLAGCATAVRYTEKPMTRYDKTTEYRVDDRPGGFSYGRSPFQVCP